MTANFEQSQAQIDAIENVAAAPVTAQLMVMVGPSPADSADRAFVTALKRAGLLGELDGRGELARLLQRTTARTEFARQLDLLELYYDASGDEEARARRVEADRFVLHTAESTENAHAIVRRLASVAPELAQASLERIGGADGPLVLRAGEHLCAVSDEDEDLRWNEVGYSLLDETNVTVRALVQAANVLLGRNGVERRWALLRCDGRREAFCALTANAALELCALGLLDERSANKLVEFCDF